MLKLLRKKGVAKKLLWVVAIIIIISFGFFGTANRLSRRSGISDAGKIFNQRISFDQFEKAMLHTRNQATLRYGENFNKISSLIDLDSETWDRIILLHEAKKQRVKILDQEVIDAIEDFDFFKDNGKFDPAVYERIVRYAFRCEPREFEEGIRESLIIAKLYQLTTASVTISDEEVEKEYRRKNEQIQVNYILFSAQDYKKDAALNPSEAQAYYEQHKESFRLPPAINIQYLNIEYPADANDQGKSDAALQAKKIFEELRANPDLEKIGKKYNLAVNESGFISREQPNLKVGLSFEVLQAAFDLAVNQISEPIETSKGYCVLKVKEKRDAYIPGFQEANEKVNEAVLLEKAREIAKQKGEEYLRQIKEALGNKPEGNFTEAAAALGLKTNQTPFFSRGQYLPTVGLSKEFQDTAFSLDDQNKISTLIETAKGYCVLHLDSRLPVDKEKFAKEKEVFAAALQAQKKGEVFTHFLGRLRASANLQDNISKLKKTKEANP